MKRILKIMTSVMLSAAITATLSITVSAKSAGGVKLNEKNFPDEVFRQLVANRFDTDNDGILSKKEITAAIELNICYEDEELPENTRGIEFLTELKTLRCRELRGFTEITGVEKLKKLNYFDTSKTEIEKLDLSKCKNLTHLYLESSSLTSLTLGDKPKLEVLSLGYNCLTELDLSGCSDLRYLSCNSNELKSLDVSGCPLIENICCSDNKLTKLDISGCERLKKLECQDNKLRSVDVSGCKELESLICRNNKKLKSLDISGCEKLERFECDKGVKFTEPPVGGKKKIPINKYTFPDEVFRQFVLDNIDLNGDKFLSGAEIYWTTSIDISNTNVHDLSGIRYFNKLWKLSCYNAPLEIIDVRYNPEITNIYCSGSSVKEIYFPESVQFINCEGTNVKTIKAPAGSSTEVRCDNETKLINCERYEMEMCE